MTAKQKLHQARLSEWAARFTDQKASGLTISQWCEQNNISFHAYNYWKHQLKEEAVDHLLPDIVPLSLPSAASNASLPSIRANRTNRTNPTIRLTISDVIIELDETVPVSYLASLIKAVRHA